MKAEVNSEMGNILGIYRWDSDRLVACFAGPGRRPTSFRAGDEQYLLILRRVRPRK